MALRAFEQKIQYGQRNSNDIGARNFIDEIGI